MFTKGGLFVPEKTVEFVPSSYISDQLVDENIDDHLDFQNEKIASENIPDSSLFEKTDWTSFQTVAVFEDSEYVTAVSCDTSEELIHVGSSTGYLQTLHFDGLSSYSCTRVSNGSVLNILCNQHVLTALGNEGVRYILRGGHNICLAEDAEGACDMAWLSGTDDLVLGWQDRENMLGILDSHTLSLRVTSSPEKNAAVTCVASGRAVLSGHADGSIVLRDPYSLSKTSSVMAHSGPVSKISLKGDTVITCGMTVRQGLMPDNVVNVYDVRNTLRPLRTVPLPSPITSLSFHPQLPTQMYALCPDSGLYFKELYLDSPPLFLPVHSSGILGCVDMSSAASVLVLGDGVGQLSVLVPASSALSALEHEEIGSEKQEEQKEGDNDDEGKEDEALEEKTQNECAKFFSPSPSSSLTPTTTLDSIAEFRPGTDLRVTTDMNISVPEFTPSSSLASALAHGQVHSTSTFLEQSSLSTPAFESQIRLNATSAGHYPHPGLAVYPPPSRALDCELSTQVLIPQYDGAVLLSDLHPQARTYLPGPSQPIPDGLRSLVEYSGFIG
eukprot:GCRY01004217.1.p1 GENE.GCRY01004217.1~~GCRY01004217.1.p1  ORF type:complete len:555 (-),score=82.42 GCRY01004217.1:23-1687(-)